MYYKIENPLLSKYLKILRYLLSSASLSLYYPDVKEYLNALALWDPNLSIKKNKYLDISSLSNLPGEPAFTRLFNELKIFKNNSVPHNEQSYYDSLKLKPFPHRFSMKISLRKIDYENNRAFFRVILDRLDISEGVLVRYTINLIHKNSHWKIPLIALNGEYLKYTEHFRNEISVACQDESELAMIILLRLKEVEIESIVRGRIGPLWFGEHSTSDVISKILRDYPNSFILNFPIDHVFTDGSENISNDPFEKIYKDSVSVNTAKELDELGYNVYKERQMKIFSTELNSIKEDLLKIGKKLIIY